GRAADPAGLAGYVASLQQGSTLEQVIASLVSSAEYFNRAAQTLPGGDPNVAWLRVLYRDLLGRAPSASDVQSWLDTLSRVGRNSVALGFANSAECRSLQIRAMYGQLPIGVVQSPNLLHRRTAPSAAEVNAWLQTGQSLLQLEVSFASTPEFAAQG